MSPQLHDNDRAQSNPCLLAVLKHHGHSAKNLTEIRCGISYVNQFRSNFQAPRRHFGHGLAWGTLQIQPARNQSGPLVGRPNACHSARNAIGFGVSGRSKPRFER